jgi:hypothetical protein
VSRLVAWRGIAVTLVGEPALLDELAVHFPPFFDDQGAPVAEARLRSTDGQLTVELPDGLTVSGSHGTEVFRAGCSRIELLIAARLPGRVAVHAGVVAWEGRAIVIPGLSMSGKSTLVRALVAAGATYLSDEFALLDEHGLVWPYPRLMTMRTSTGTHRTLPSPSAEAAGPGVPVGVVADLPYSADGWQTRVASQGQTVMSLAGNSLPIKRAPSRTLDSLTAVADGALCVRGSRGEADDAVSRLLALLRP